MFISATWMAAVPRASLHALCSLPGDVCELEHLVVGLLDVQVLVQAAALAPLRDDGQVVLRHVAHEQQDVDMTRLPANRGG